MEQEDFEIYAHKDGKWTSDSTHQKKNLAISLALALLNKSDNSAICIVKKNKTVPSNSPFGSVVYKDGEEDPKVTDKSWDDFVSECKQNIQRAAQDQLNEKTQAAVKEDADLRASISKSGDEKRKKIYRRIFKFFLIGGGSLVALAAAIYFLLDYLAKL